MKELAGSSGQGKADDSEVVDRAGSGKGRFSLAGLVTNNAVFGLIIALLMLMSLQGCFIYHDGGHGHGRGGYDRHAHYDHHR